MYIGVFKSINLPNAVTNTAVFAVGQYQHNQHCREQFTCPTNSEIHFLINYLDIEYVSLYDEYMYPYYAEYMMSNCVYDALQLNFYGSAGIVINQL